MNTHESKGSTVLTGSHDCCYRDVDDDNEGDYIDVDD